MKSKMLKVQSYSFGYVIEKVGYLVEELSESTSYRISHNIFGQEILVENTHRVNFCKFTPGVAVSTQFKTESEAWKFLHRNKKELNEI